MASIDMLSGLANRRGSRAGSISNGLEGPGSVDEELSLLMIDVDHFEAENNAVAARGDACLTRLSEALAPRGAADAWALPAAMAADSCCCRTQPAASARDQRETARAANARPRPAAHHLQLARHRSRRHSPRTASGSTPTPGDLIEAADAALYPPQHGGRNPGRRARLCQAGG